MGFMFKNKILVIDCAPYIPYQKEKSKKNIPVVNHNQSCSLVACLKVKSAQ